MQRAPEISVVLCTRNRASSLETCLAHLAASGSQLGVAWELVVVDNGSTDATSDTIARWAVRLPMRALQENRRGLSVARNTGLRAASGRIVALLDDDCLVTHEWLGAIRTAHAGGDSADGIGGRVALSDRADLPVSIRDFDDARDVTDLAGIMGRLIGCNFSARAEALRAVGGFDERLGAGTSAMSGEDFDVFYRMLRAGMRLRYEPAILLFHAHGRRTNEQLRKLMRGYLVGRGAWYAKQATRGDAAVLRSAYWEVRRLVAAALRRSSSGASEDGLHPAKQLTALAQGALQRLRGGG